MTNTTRRPNNRPRCIDCNVQLNTRNFNYDRHNGTENPLCDFCYDRASFENEHQDGAHDADAEGPDMNNCTMCNPALLKDRSKPSNVVKAHTRMSHAACYAAKAHDKTREGREGCRQARAAKA